MIKNIFYLCLFAGMVMVSCDQKEGTTLSGFQYELIQSNQGKTPLPGQIVYYHVTTMTEDKMIKTSRIQDHPQVFEMPEDQKLIDLGSPFLDILKHLSVGDSALVYQSIESDTRLPPEYGDAKEIIYGVYLVDIISDKEYEEDRSKQRLEVQANKQDYRDKESVASEAMAKLFEKDPESRMLDFTETESGLKYKILKQGHGKMLAENSKHMVDLSYYGCLSNGERLESSYKYGIPHRFVRGSGNIMPGWNEAAGMFPAGTEAVIYVPSELAFGDRAFKGNVQIPANEDLYFHFVIEDVIAVKKY